VVPRTLKCRPTLTNSLKAELDTLGVVPGGLVLGSSGKPSLLEANNRVAQADRAAHDWFRFVLSFPPHLVRHYAEKFKLGPTSLLLDPFCGTGTTLVEAKKLGIPSVGVEAHPFTAFAAAVKVDWTPDPEELIEHASGVAEIASEHLRADGVPDTPLDGVPGAKGRTARGLRRLSPDLDRLILTDSISPRPLHKVLVLLEVLERERDDRYRTHEVLALAQSMVHTSSNLRFGPEVGLGRIKPDAPVVAPWLRIVGDMAQDLRTLSSGVQAPSRVYSGDARSVSEIVEAESVEAVITSPPYPNEKDYTRTTRLESVLLGFVQDKQALKLIKQGMVRSNTRGIFKADTDDNLVGGHAEIVRIAREIEARRVALGKTSGFEKLYPRAVKLYFGGMLRHLRDLSKVLRPGARLAYVVGDQASYLRVMIRTGQILGDLAKSAGYEVEGLDLFRTRYASATSDQLREEVLLLRWPAKE
jgi:tRNA G10  N-methylase Trm11